MSDKSTIEGVDVKSTDGEKIITIVNGLARSVQPLRVFPGLLDTEIISAAIAFAGCIHGELIALGLMDEGSDQGPEQIKLVTHNYMAGVEAGKAKIATVKAKQAERGEDQTGFEAPSFDDIIATLVVQPNGKRVKVEG